MRVGQACDFIFSACALRIFCSFCSWPHERHFPSMRFYERVNVLIHIAALEFKCLHTFLLLSFIKSAIVHAGLPT